MIIIIIRSTIRINDDNDNTVYNNKHNDNNINMFIL